MFQSLVGTLKTRTGLNFHFVSPAVSIPRRYAKNTLRCSPGPLYVKFQSLVGTLKTMIAGSLKARAFVFQSLVGTLKTKMPQWVCLVIPKFQSLVGTLKTGLFGLDNNVAVKFQSLVGTLKTWTRRQENQRILQFQSLVGTLKTKKFGNLFADPLLVSIPRRYAKNSVPVGSTSRRDRVSIPRRYAKNRLLVRQYPTAPISFNPS